MTTTGAALDRGREAFRREAWATASDELTAAEKDQPLGGNDLELLATAAYLAGRDTDSQAAWEQAHQAHLRGGDRARAARCGFWLSMALILRGDVARGSGWVGRSQRLVDEPELDCAERGFLQLPAAFATLFGGGPAAAYEIFGQAAAIGERFAERDLIALARHGQAQSLIRQGEQTTGLALLDEVMAGVTAGEAGPIATGLIYCAVVEVCQEIFDLRRAHEWTLALSDWCAGQPELVPYRGQCLVHRSELMQQSGDWPEAMEEAERACRLLSDPPPGQPALGRAAYQLGELHRLRGETAEAEAAYRQAGECGHHPQPGLALLRLAQGRIDAADASIRGAADEATEPLERARVLSAYVEIVLATGDVAAARGAADELAGIASEIGAAPLRTVAAQARGAVLLAEGEARGALEALREAGEGWRVMTARYDGARTRVLIGQARRALGDLDTAQLELDGARAAFVELGATPDVQRVDDLLPAAAGVTGRGQAAGLSPRELEVLRLVATGRTNSAIAADLVLSEKTVARHLSNIFTKLGLSSRSAATAYAYENHLL